MYFYAWNSAGTKKLSSETIKWSTGTIKWLAGTIIGSENNVISSGYKIILFTLNVKWYLAPTGVIELELWLMAVVLKTTIGYLLFSIELAQITSSNFKRKFTSENQKTLEYEDDIKAILKCFLFVINSFNSHLLNYLLFHVYWNIYS